MALKYSEAIRNARLDQIESSVGSSPFFQIRTGAPPANITDPDSGTLLVDIPLPADWMNNASSGQKTKLGTWQANGAASGVAAHFRVKNNAKTITHIQGTVTGSGGGGDMELDNINIATGQQVTVTQFTLTSGNT